MLQSEISVGFCFSNCVSLVPGQFQFHFPRRVRILLLYDLCVCVCKCVWVIVMQKVFLAPRLHAKSIVSHLFLSVSLSLLVSAFCLDNNNNISLAIFYFCISLCSLSMMPACLSSVSNGITYENISRLLSFQPQFGLQFVAAPECISVCSPPLFATLFLYEYEYVCPTVSLITQAHTYIYG